MSRVSFKMAGDSVQNTRILTRGNRPPNTRGTFLFRGPPQEEQLTSMRGKEKRGRENRSVRVRACPSIRRGVFWGVHPAWLLTPRRSLPRRPPFPTTQGSFLGVHPAWLLTPADLCQDDHHFLRPRGVFWAFTRHGCLLSVKKSLFLPMFSQVRGFRGLPASARPRFPLNSEYRLVYFESL